MKESLGRGTERLVTQQKLVKHPLIEQSLVKLTKVSHVVLVDLDEFLRVVNLFFEENEVAQSAHEVVADRDLSQFGAFIEVGVVH